MSNPDPAKVAEVLRNMGVPVDDEHARPKTAEPEKKPERPEDDPNHPDYDPMAALNIGSHDEIIQLAGDLMGEHREEEEPPLRRDGEGPATELYKNRPPVADRWTRIIPGLGVVGVTDEEKRIFENSFLHDDRIELPIKFKISEEIEMVVVCRTVYIHEREVIAEIVRRLVETHTLATMATMAVATEFAIRVNALVQVVSVGKKEWPAINLRRVDGESAANHPKIDEVIRLARDGWEGLQSRHFALISRAMHIFEVKMTILEDALANQDFTTPAGSD